MQNEETYSCCQFGRAVSNWLNPPNGPPKNEVSGV